MTATQELVVPKSIPIIFPILNCLYIILASIRVPMQKPAIMSVKT
jgi:hypothetical protein